MPIDLSTTGRAGGGLRRCPRGRCGLWLVLGLALGIPLGCGGDVVGIPPAQDPSLLYWALVLDQHAITLDTLMPYNTVRIRATPHTIHGDSLSGLAAVTYRSTDLERVRVSTDGLVQAVKPGTQIAVVATLTVGEVTHADTALINVTALGTGPPTLASFSIHPLAPDSARWAANVPNSGSYHPAADTLPLRALDGAGQPLAGLAVDYRSSDPAIATVAPSRDPASGVTRGVIQGRHPGPGRFIASATAYGVRAVDTLLFTITMPLSVTITIERPYLGAPNWVLTPPEVTIEAGGEVVWGLFGNFYGDSVPAGTVAQQLDVVFDDPTPVTADSLYCVPEIEPYLEAVLGQSCGAGNVPVFGDTTTDFIMNVLANNRFRQFPVAGTYAYHSSVLGAAGVIHVVHTPEASLRVGTARGP